MDSQIVNRITDLTRRVSRLETIEQPPKSYGLWANRPASPFNGQRYFAVDASDKLHNLRDWVWSSAANNWLSQSFQVTLTPENYANPVPGTVNGASYLALYPIMKNLWVEGLSVEMSFGVAQTSTNHFTVGDVLGFASSVVTTGKGVGRAVFNFTEEAGTFTPGAVAVANNVIGASIVETGTAAGTTYIQAAMQVRLIG